ncbi:HDIG domain-containing protein [Desulfonatronum thiosulfatophilum]|uniref:HDIG domain-containing protein n=1 Tax=Desulfonatronum thiosulfatophilum TaxID=617002 RepID=A0A1G6AXC0_9BACT|nr:HD domain-containing protein [Desulfonatronum thiosulfatophilum]SDB12939.1 HDIG domain-containing protein [Desulfonatronum thiosulfatophilum]
MMVTELERGVLELCRFARDHYPQEQLERANMALKLDHCLRVFQEAESIAMEEKLEPDAVRVTLWAALFHDVGRFPQYLAYKTFDDRKSVDHGRLGVRVLKKHGFLEGLSAQTQKAVRTAIILHNKRFLSASLPEWAAVPARVVRDADKLDIYKILLQHLRPDAANNPVVTMDLRDEPEVYNEELVRQILDGELGDYSRMQTLNDFRLLLCSWVYDLNFSATKKAVIQRGYLDELLSGLPDTPRIRQVRKTVLARVREYATEPLN